MYPIIQPFQRLFAEALDGSTHYTTLEALELYASINPTAYVGQLCVLKVADILTVYVIESDLSVRAIDRTSEDVVVYGKDLGMYKIGDTIPKGTLITDMLKNMVQEVNIPIYVAPTLTAVDTIPNSIEIGNLLTGVITPTFTQNDGGIVTKYSVNLPNATPELREYETVQEVLVVTGDAFPVTSTSVNVTLTVEYEQGEILNDNMGNPYPTGRIEAGSKTFTISIIGYVPYFYIADTGIAASTSSSQLRALTNSVVTASNGTTFNISIPTGTTRIEFAYRNTLQDVTSVAYVQLGNAEMKDLFTKTSVAVTGINGIGGGTYKVFTYLPEASFGDNATFIVTI